MASFLELGAHRAIFFLRTLLGRALLGSSKVENFLSTEGRGETNVDITNTDRVLSRILSQLNMGLAIPHLPLNEVSKAAGGVF